MYIVAVVVKARRMSNAAETASTSANHGPRRILTPSAIDSGNAAKNVRGRNPTRVEVNAKPPIPSAKTISWLTDQGISIVVARVDGSVPYDQVDYRGPLAIVLGSEAHGLAGTWLGPGIQAVSLPMLGIADSLNVSAAAAILLYEARRQRLRT